MIYACRIGRQIVRLLGSLGAEDWQSTPAALVPQGIMRGILDVMKKIFLRRPRTHSHFHLEAVMYKRTGREYTALGATLVLAEDILAGRRGLPPFGPPSSPSDVSVRVGRPAVGESVRTGRGGPARHRALWQPQATAPPYSALVPKSLSGVGRAGRPGEASSIPPPSLPPAAAWICCPHPIIVARPSRHPTSGSDADPSSYPPTTRIRSPTSPGVSGCDGRCRATTVVAAATG